jgi:hypothetical protein
MDNRFYKRTSVNLNARIIADGRSFEGAIENVSEGGVGYIINSSIKDSTDFKPAKKIEISFRTSSGNNINLECEIAWFSRPPAGTTDLALGLKIVDPPSEYKEWITNLTGSSIIKKLK